MNTYYAYWSPTWANENGKSAVVTAKSKAEAIKKFSKIHSGNPESITS